MPAEVEREQQILESRASLLRTAGIHQNNLNNANYVLRHSLGERQTRLDQAREARDRAYAGLSEVDASLGQLDRELAEERAKMVAMGINPRDWDGFSPAEIRARKQREERFRRPIAWTDGIPLGR